MSESEAALIGWFEHQGWRFCVDLELAAATASFEKEGGWDVVTAAGLSEHEVILRLLASVSLRSLQMARG